MFQPRTYRRLVNSPGLLTYPIVEQETDLYVSTLTDLSREARALVRGYRRELNSYLAREPYFAASLEPLDAPDDAPPIVKDMAAAARLAGVGPMAAVAGAIARFVGEELGKLSPEVIIENGGDIYLRSLKKRVVAIYAGSSPLSGILALEIAPGNTPAGICTSSATVGPSLSFGGTDATVIVAPSATLADAAATAVGNAVGSSEEIGQGLEMAQAIKGLTGAVIIVGEHIGVWGNLKLCPLERGNPDVVG